MNPKVHSHDRSGEEEGENSAALQRMTKLYEQRLAELNVLQKQLNEAHENFDVQLKTQKDNYEKQILKLTGKLNENELLHR